MVQLIQCVEQTYNEYPPDKINRIFITLQSVFNEILYHHSDNEYKIAHMNNDKLEQESRLPEAVWLTEETLEDIPQEFFDAA
jgi:hypothetical protein